jgi:hypothetical protein
MVGWVIARLLNRGRAYKTKIDTCRFHEKRTTLRILKPTPAFDAIHRGSH